MDDEQRRVMIDALEQAFAEVGIDLYSGAPRLLHFLDSNRPYVEACCSPEALRTLLSQLSETDAAQFATYAAFFNAFPKLLQQFVMDCVVTTAASAPTPVGPPRKLTPEIEREIVRRVTELYVDGSVGIGIAQSRVAQQLGLGKRTIQTVWRRRQQLSAQPFQSMSDIWKFLEGTIPKE